MLARSRYVGMFAIGAVLLLCAFAQAADPDQQCASGRYQGAGKFARCHLQATAKFESDGDSFRFGSSLVKCSARYVSTYAKLQARASGTGSACDAPRFVDGGDGTITDHLTGLQWEKKVNFDLVSSFGDPHDGDNTYHWTDPLGSTAADGNVYTLFLDTLNGGCFAGHCDWRLPTLGEFLTLLQAPCVGGCIDPIFGGPASGSFWTATTDAVSPTQAWAGTANVIPAFSIDKRNLDSARAVRGGL